MCVKQVEGDFLEYFFFPAQNDKCKNNKYQLKYQ